jgi:biofilm protein TabA
MKIRKSILTGILIILIVGCSSNNNSKSPEKWSKKQVSEWFDKKEWLGQTELQSDTSLDKREFAVQYNKHKEWWDKAFNFLKNKDLSALSVGVIELDSQNVFVKVSEYNTKDPETTPFEVHKAYADIHYVISGTEDIGRAVSATAVLKTPFDAEKDVALYEAAENQSLVAKPGIFFIIFPNELHRPGIKIGESVWVKKIVIKVRI